MDHQAGQNDGLSAANQVGSAGAEALHIWRPRPLVRAIEWNPINAGVPSDNKAYEVFVMQDTLAELLKRVYSSTSGSEFGFLVGDLCECPETGIRYVVMTSTIEARNRFDENGTPQIPAEAYVAMQLKLDRRVGSLVGWYHVHRDADEVSLSENDIATHEKYFSDPWQSSLIVAPTPEGPLGGFFRRVGGNLDGDACRPFFEVLSARSFVARGVRHTCMNWRNYASEGETVLIPFEGADGTTTPPKDLPPSVAPVVEDTVEAPLMEEPQSATESVVEDWPSVPDSAFTPPSPPADESLALEEPLAVEEPPAPVQPPAFEEPLAPEPPSTGGIAADFADLKEAHPEPEEWTPGHEETPEEEGPLYSAEPGQSINRLADRQGELPDQRFAEMRAPYPAPEPPAQAEPSIAERMTSNPLAAAAGLEPRISEPVEMDVAAAETDSEPDSEPDTLAAPAPAKRRRRRKSRSFRKRHGINGKRLAMVGIAVVVIAGGGFAALKLPEFFGGDKSAATTRRPLGATDGPAMAAVGGLEAEGQGADAAGLGALGATTDPIADAAGAEPVAADGTPVAADSGAAGEELLVDAETLGDTPSMPPESELDDPASVADEVARLAKPLPDRAYAAPVLAIDGTVVELNDERARRAASRRRALAQAAADSSAEEQLRTIRRPTVSAPAPVAGEPGLTDVSIDRPELLQKLDRLSDTLSATLNTYFVETLALQNDEGSCDDVTRAFGRVGDAWKDYNGALGSPRVVTFEGTRAARDVQLSERVQEVQSSYSGLDCD